MKNSLKLPPIFHQALGKIVDDCVMRGAAQAIKNDLNCSEKATLNMAIGHCIHRELFFQCPAPSTSSECQDLVSYAKDCKKFPFPPEKDEKPKAGVKG
jgi:hypothetical protein